MKFETIAEFKEFLKTLVIKDEYSNFTYEPFYGVEWVTGGQYGGSCWDGGDSNYRTIDTEDEPPFDIMDKIFDAVCPDIMYREAKRIIKEVVESGTHRQDEYYGNYTIYSYHRVDVEKLMSELNSL